MSSYEVVTYRPEFKERVLELQTQLWSPSLALNRAYFDWKHERNPHSPSPIYLAVHGGKVVGMRSFFKVRLEASPPHQTLTALYADDLVIDRAHRNRGLIHKIMRVAFIDLAAMGYEYILNLSAGPITYASSLAMGWRDAGTVRPMRFRPWGVYCQDGISRATRAFNISFRHAIRPRNDRTRSLAEMDSSQLSSYFRKSPSVSFALSPCIDAMAALVARMAGDGRIRQVRDQPFLTWRYQNPFSRYGFLCCWNGDDLEGYLVLKEQAAGSSDSGVFSVVDWEASGALVSSRLLDAARRLTSLCGRKLIIWSASLSEEWIALLAQKGFRAMPEEQDLSTHHTTHVLVRALAENRQAPEWRLAGRQLTDLKEWDLRMLYSMHG